MHQIQGLLITGGTGSFGQAFGLVRQHRERFLRAWNEYFA